MMIEDVSYADGTGRIMELHLSRLVWQYGFCFDVVDMREMNRKIRINDHNLLSIMSDKELEYLKKVKNSKNILQWISGRYAVKSAFFKYKLERQSIIDLKCVDVLKGADSAPYLLQYPDINASITHSFPYCIGAVSQKKIGIDIEKIFVPEDSLIQYFFSDKEKELLASLMNADEYSTKSTILWTRKEAVSKLLRLGMKVNFKELDTLQNEIHYYDKNRDCIRLSSFVCRDFCLSFAVIQT